MAHLLKQNIENLGGSSVKGRIGNAPFEGVKKLKTLIKPLSDVKNIIEDKIKPEQVKKDVPVNSMVVPVITESNYDEELFFYSQLEDLYDDIIPKSLQLEESDISKLVAVFDYLPLKKGREELVPLPELEIKLTFTDNVYEDLCGVIKGLDSTGLLFDD